MLVGTNLEALNEDQYAQVKDRLDHALSDFFQDENYDIRTAVFVSNVEGTNIRAALEELK